MSEDKYMVIVVDNAEDFVKELNETADDNWTLHSFQVTLGPVGLLILGTIKLTSHSRATRRIPT